MKQAPEVVHGREAAGRSTLDVQTGFVFEKHLDAFDDGRQHGLLYVVELRDALEGILAEALQDPRQRGVAVVLADDVRVRSGFSALSVYVP